MSTTRFNALGSAVLQCWWLYFVVGNDTDSAEGVSSASNFWTGEYYNTHAHKCHVYTHERIITLDELPDF